MPPAPIAVPLPVVPTVTPAASIDDREPPCAEGGSLTTCPVQAATSSAPSKAPRARVATISTMLASLTHHVRGFTRRWLSVVRRAGTNPIGDRLDGCFRHGNAGWHLLCVRAHADAGELVKQVAVSNVAGRNE